MPVPGVMGGMNPANLEQLAAAGDPRAIQMLQQMQAAQGGGPGAGGMPPQGGGMPPIGGAPPMGAAPPMSQADFSGYPAGGGGQLPPDVAARRAQMLIQALRNRQ